MSESRPTNDLAIECRRLQDEIAELRKRMIAADRKAAVLDALSAETSVSTGTAFFQLLAKSLAKALDVRYVFVATCLETRHRARMLAFWTGEQFGENREYEVEDTPCEAVVGGKTVYHKEHIQKRFPLDQDLADLQAESYCGVPLLDEQQTVIGHLVILDTKPMQDDLSRVPALRAYAARASAELQRQIAVDRLTDQTNLLNGVIERTEDPIFVKDLDGRYVLMNSAEAESHGKNPESLSGLTDEELYPELADELTECDRQIIETGLPNIGEHTFTQPGGDSKTYSIRKHPRVDASGKVTGIVGIARDITWLRRSEEELEHRVNDRTRELTEANRLLQHEIDQRRRAEAELQEANKLLDSIVENIPYMIFLKDAVHLRFVRLNKAGEELLGHSREDLAGKNDYDFFPKNQADFFTSLDKEVLKHRVRKDIPEEAIQTLFRGTRYLHTRKVPVLDESGNAKYLLGISEDITERKEAQKALRLTRFAVDNAVEAMFTVAPTGRILDANETACRRLEYTREELLSMSISDIDPDYPKELWPTHWIELREKGHMVIETVHCTKSGRIFPVEVSIAYFKFGGVEYCCSSIRDITERKKTEEEVRKARDSLEDLVAERTDQLQNTVEQLENEIAARRKSEDVIRRIAEGTSTAVGPQFFHSLAVQLAETLGVHYASVCENLDLPATRVRTLGRCVDFQLREDIEFNIIGTPCEAPSNGTTTFVADDLPAQYPEDTHLAESGMRSFCGIPLCDSSGVVIGHITVMDLEPMSENLGALPAVRIFAARAAAELERKRAEDALRLSETRFMRLVDSNIIGVMTANMSGMVEDANDAFLNMVGYEREDLPFRWDDMTPEEWRARDEIALEQLRTTGVALPWEKQYFRKDGGRVWVLGGVARLHQNSDKLICFKLDVTARKNAEEALRKTEEKIRHHQSELAHVARLNTMGEMASGLAHELNQPLFALGNHVEALSRAMKNAGTDLTNFEPTIRKLADEVHRAGEIIKRIRNFVRKRQPQRSVISVNRTIREAMKLMEQELKQARVDVRLDLADKVDTLAADSVQLQQVVLNLARNSLEAMTESEEGPRRLSIRSVAADDGTLEIAVRDTAPPVSDELYARLFDPFHSTKREGLGMGLPISRTIVEAHGGEMKAERNADRGLTFSFTLRR